MKRIILGGLIALMTMIAHAERVKYEVNTEDGESQSKHINVFVNYDSENKKLIELNQINDLVKRTSGRIKTMIKNEYSYNPRYASINQQGQSFLLMMKYTAKNDYGADVVNEYEQNYIMKDDGSFR